MAEVIRMVMIGDMEDFGRGQFSMIFVGLKVLGVMLGLIGRLYEVSCVAYFIHLQSFLLLFLIFSVK